MRGEKERGFWDDPKNLQAMYYRTLYDGGEILYHSSILSSLTQIFVREEGRVGDGGGTKYDQIRALYILPHLLM